MVSKNNCIISMRARVFLVPVLLPACARESVFSLSRLLRSLLRERRSEGRRQGRRKQL
jgi:hypothetical protein